MSQIFISKNNYTVTPLGANATFTGTADVLTSFAEIDINSAGLPLSAPGLLYFEFSSDGITWDISVPLTLSGPNIVPVNLRTVSLFFRVRYVNGSTPLTYFKLTVTLHRESSMRLTRFLSQPIDPNESVEMVRVAGSVLPDGAATDVTLSKLTIAQNTSLGSNTQILTGGSVTTSSPTYTNGNINPISLTTAGAIRIDGSAVTQPVSGTITANQGTSNTLANAWGVKVSDGTDTVGISTVGGAKALKVDVVQSVGGGGTGTSSNFNAVFPSAGTASGFSDGTNMQGAKVFDLDTGGGVDYNLGMSLRLPGSGGSVAGGTLSNPIRVDTTGTTTQPVSGTVTSNIGTTGGLALDSSLTTIDTDIKATQPRDITDRAGRLLGVIYGSQGQQLKQTATNFNTQVEIAVGATLIDPRSIRALTASDVVTANAGSGTFTVSGSVTANIGTTNGLALDTSVNGLLVSQGSTTSGEKGTLIQGAVTTASPSYTTAQTSPLSLTTAGALRTDSSATTQPVSGTITANAGSGTFTVGGTVTSNIGTTNGLALDATLAKLTIAQSASLGSNTQTLIGGSVTTAAPTYTTGNINPLSLTTAGAIRVDGSGVTQPVSGTVTANIGTTNGLALDTSVNGLLVSQGSTTSGEKGPMIQGAVTTAAPSYTTAQTSPLSLTTAGALRIDGSGVTQPVSGTVTANQGTANTLANSWGVKISDGTDTVGISTVGAAKALKVDVIQSVGGGSGGTSSSFGATFPAAGTASGFSDGTNMQGGKVFDLDTGGGTDYNIGVSLRLPASGGSVVGGTNTNPIRIDPTGTTIQPVSGTVTANIGTTNGLALDTSVNGLLVSQGSTTSGEKGTLIQGAVTTAAPSYTTAQTSPLSLTTTGALRVDGSAVTQPVSGAVTANAGSGTFTVSGTVTSNIGTTGGLALDTTLAKLTITQSTALGSNTQALIGGSVTTAAPTYTTGNINPLSLTTAGALRIDGSGVTQPISGTITANIGTTNGLALDTSVNGLLVSQGSTTSGEKGTLIQGAVTTGSPSYTTAQTSPLSLTTAGALRTDSSATTQPISGTVTANAGSGTFTVSGTVTSNIGTTGGLALDATLAKLTITQSTALGSNTQALIGGSVTTAAPTYTTGNINPISLTTAGAVRIDGSGVTQPVSGTVTANIGTTNGLALDTSVNGIIVSQGSTTSGEKGALIQGAVTTGAPSYTTAQTSPLSLTTAGALRIDGSAVTQPVSGTITANAGSGTFTVSGTVTANIGTTNGLALDTSVNGIIVSQGSTTSGEKGPLIQGAVTTAAPSYTTAQTSPLSLTTAGALRTDSSATTQPVSGTVTANAGSGTFTVGGTVTANIGTTNGLALDATLAKLTVAQSASLGSNTQALMGASVTTAAPTYTTGNINPLSLTTAGALRIDGSGVTQPVSGTVTANQGGTWTVQPGNTANTTPWLTTINQGGNSATVTAGNALKVDGSAVTQPVSGTVTSNQGTSPWVENVSQFGGTNISTGTGASGAGIPRVTVSNDSNILATQSGSWTVTSNIGTTNGLALDATLTGGNQVSILKSGTKGTSPAALVTSSSVDANTQALHVLAVPSSLAIQNAATVTANGSAILTNIDAASVSLILNIIANPTGTLPTLTYTMSEVDPIDQTTIVGQTITGAAISSITNQTLTLQQIKSNTIKISWVVSGVSPSFTGVNATVIGQLAPQVQPVGGANIDGSAITYNPVMVGGKDYITNLVKTLPISANPPPFGASVTVIGPQIEILLQSILVQQQQMTQLLTLLVTYNDPTIPVTLLQSDKSLEARQIMVDPSQPYQ